MLMQLSLCSYKVSKNNHFFVIQSLNTSLNNYLSCIKVEDNYILNLSNCNYEWVKQTEDFDWTGQDVAG